MKTTISMPLRVLILSLNVALAVSLAGMALAHAFLDHAAPGAGMEVVLPPSQVRLWFTQKLEPAFSDVTVTDDQGERFDDGGSWIDSADHTLMIVKLKPLHPGSYTVSWHVVSVDTHRTEGSYVFAVMER